MSGEFNCRGEVVGNRRKGIPLLFLLGERHSALPFIRENLLNVLELDALGAISCVAVEGNPDTDVPGAEAKAAFDRLRAAHGDNDKAIIDGMLGSLRDHHFWKLLSLLRPRLKIAPVDDAELRDRADGLRPQFIKREGYIAQLLKASGVTPEEAVTRARIQAEHEFGEDLVHVKRDKIMLDKLKVLWRDAGMAQAAVLNAGSSHQYRIARRLPHDWAYFHIEQP
jgi:hypothetical protein